VHGWRSASAADGPRATAGGWAAAMTTHTPVRPSWTCADCSAAWPCHTRRQQLLAECEGAHVALSIFVGVCPNVAANDLADALPDGLYSRFLGWRG
jgi:hypothetical protein